MLALCISGALVFGGPFNPSVIRWFVFFVIFTILSVGFSRLDGLIVSYQIYCALTRGFYIFCGERNLLKFNTLYVRYRDQKPLGQREWHPSIVIEDPSCIHHHEMTGTGVIGPFFGPTP